MNRIFFLNSQQMSQYGFIHGNVEEDLVMNTLFRVQESQIQPIVGSPLYRKLKEMVVAWNTTPGSASGDYYDLMVNYIVPALIPMVERKITFHLNSEIQNKGVGANRDEYMTSNNVAENNNIRDELSKDATFFKNQLIAFLEDDNGVKYPEYLECTGKKADFKPEDRGPDYLNKISII